MSLISEMPWRLLRRFRLATCACVLLIRQRPELNQEVTCSEHRRTFAIAREQYSFQGQDGHISNLNAPALRPDNRSKQWEDRAGSVPAKSCGPYLTAVPISEVTDSNLRLDGRLRHCVGGR